MCYDDDDKGATRWVIRTMSVFGPRVHGHARSMCAARSRRRLLRQGRTRFFNNKVEWLVHRSQGYCLRWAGNLCGKMLRSHWLDWLHGEKKISSGTCSFVRGEKKYGERQSLLHISIFLSLSWRSSHHVFCRMMMRFTCCHQLASWKIWSPFLKKKKIFTQTYRKDERRWMGDSGLRFLPPRVFFFQKGSPSSLLIHIPNQNQLWENYDEGGGSCLLILQRDFL